MADGRISKMVFAQYLSCVSTDFDEIWYTVANFDWSRVKQLFFLQIQDGGRLSYGKSFLAVAVSRRQRRAK